MKCAVGFCGHCQYGPHFICKDGPVFPYDRVRPIGWENMNSRCRSGNRSSACANSHPAMAASSACSTAEDELLGVAGAVEIAYFVEAQHGPC